MNYTSGMRITQDFLLLSFKRAGPESLRRAVVAFAGFVGLVGLALVVVLTLAPSRLPSYADLGADGPVGAINRVGKVVYGPGPNNSQCRRFQFDNRTAALEQTGEADCSVIMGKRPQLDGQSNPGGIRDSFRRWANDVHRETAPLRAISNIRTEPRRTDSRAPKDICITPTAFFAQWKAWKTAIWMNYRAYAVRMSGVEDERIYRSDSRDSGRRQSGQARVWFLSQQPWASAGSTANGFRLYPLSICYHLVILRHRRSGRG
jgi:hypothetical protein